MISNSYTLTMYYTFIMYNYNYYLSTIFWEKFMASGLELINRIDKILFERNKTRNEFAKEINIQPNTMGNWKTNNSMPPVDTIQKIAIELEVSAQWLIDGDINFEENTNFLGAQSRKSIRERIYIALKNKYKDKDNRFTNDFLSNPILLKELHNYYFSGDFVTFNYLYNWSKGRCEIEFFKFNQLAIGLNTSLSFLITGSETLVSTKNGYSTTFEKKLYDLALEFRNELYCLDCLTEDRKESAIKIINQLMRLEHLEYVEKNRKDQ